MFHLWLGAMFGVFAGYAVSRWRESRSWPSGLWAAVLLFGGVALLILIYDLVLEIRYISLIAGIKSVVAPWLAGVGFGGWIFYLIKQSAPMQSPADDGAAASALKQPTVMIWAPILVAFLLVGFVVSDERYGWFSRLQRVTFGGGGVEFAPLASSTQSQQALEAYTNQVARPSDRLSQAFSFMERLPDDIRNDRELARKLAPGDLDESAYHRDLHIAENIISPIGKYLVQVQRDANYDDLNQIVHPAVPDKIRQLFGRHQVQYLVVGDGSTLSELVQLLTETWRKACSLLPGQENQSLCEAARARLSEEIAPLQRGELASQFGFNPALGYGQLLSAHLTWASGKSDTADRDLERWIEYATKRGQRALEPMLLRHLRYRATLYDLSGRSGDAEFQSIANWQSVMQLSGRLLDAIGVRVPGLPSSRAAWATEPCSDALPRSPDSATSSQKAVAELLRVYLVSKNNYVYRIADDPEFTDRSNLAEKLAEHTEQLEKINVECLGLPRKNERILQAGVSDTVAWAHFRLGARSAARSERRVHYCAALRHARAAVRVQESASDFASAPTPGDVRTVLDFVKRLKTLNAVVEREGFDC